jgi:hypothetical protein
MKNIVSNFEAVGYGTIEELHKCHELPTPCEVFSKKIFHSEALVKLWLPAAQILPRIFKIQNKILVIGRKPYG